jgi:hypothetical protein
MSLRNLLTTYQTIRCHISEGHTTYPHVCQNPRFSIDFVCDLNNHEITERTCVRHVLAQLSGTLQDVWQVILVFTQSQG